MIAGPLFVNASGTIVGTRCIWYVIAGRLLVNASQPGNYVIECKKGYVPAWMDDGSNYFRCENGAFNVTQSALVTCAPGCLDLSTDIVPYT